MTKLLYHANQAGDNVSPFDEAIVHVARSGPVRIVSPYIGVAYLERIIGISKEWRLISDVQEWLGSLPTLARPRAWQFIRENIELIHHCPALHAKAVISDSLAIMGSANLTRPGILGRTEMGILMSDPKLVAEMGAWFDALWYETTPPAVDEASAFIKWLDDQVVQGSARGQLFALSSGRKKIRARLVKLDIEQPTVPHKQAPLDLSAVAQSIIAQDQKHYDSLEQAIEAAIDHLTASGDFSFKEVVGEVRYGLADATLREIYFLLVQHCANHVRSVFAEATQNRLILTNGRFSQSSRETINDALAPFDAFLLHLISYLEFDRAKGLPLEERLEQETGVLGRDQVIIVSELLYCGLLVLEDVPGELPHYSLERDFEWEGRYKLFPRSRGAWAEKIKLQAPYDIGVDASDDAEDVELPSNLVVGSHQLPEQDYDYPLVQRLPNLSKFLREAEVASELKRQLKQNKDARRKGYVDSLLARLLTMVASGQTFEATNPRALTSTVSKATGVRYEIVGDAINPGLQHAKVFLMSYKDESKNVVLDINPALSRDMLLEYPKTLDVCDKLLGGGS